MNLKLYPVEKVENIVLSVVLLIKKEIIKDEHLLLLQLDML
jgi:hypothetical protein